MASYVFFFTYFFALHPESRHVQETFNNKGKLNHVCFMMSCVLTESYHK